MNELLLSGMSRRLQKFRGEAADHLRNLDKAPQLSNVLKSQERFSERFQLLLEWQRALQVEIGLVVGVRDVRDTCSRSKRKRLHM